MRNSKIFSLITFDVFEFAKSVKESFVITFLVHKPKKIMPGTETFIRALKGYQVRRTLFSPLTNM